MWGDSYTLTVIYLDRRGEYVRSGIRREKIFGALCEACKVPRMFGDSVHLVNDRVDVLQVIIEQYRFWGTLCRRVTLDGPFFMVEKSWS